MVCWTEFRRGTWYGHEGSGMDGHGFVASNTQSGHRHISREERKKKKIKREREKKMLKI